VRLPPRKEVPIKKGEQGDRHQEGTYISAYQEDRMPSRRRYLSGREISIQKVDCQK
jgi:hypothetical protein